MHPDAFLSFECDVTGMSPLGNSWDEDVDRLMENVSPFFRAVENLYRSADLAFLLFSRPGGTFDFRVIVLKNGVCEKVIDALSAMIRRVEASGYVLVLGDGAGQTLALYSGLERSRRVLMREANGALHKLATDEPSALLLFNLGGVEELYYAGGRLHD